MYHAILLGRRRPIILGPWKAQVLRHLPRNAKLCRYFYKWLRTPGRSCFSIVRGQLRLWLLLQPYGMAHGRIRRTQGNGNVKPETCSVSTRAPSSDSAASHRLPAHITTLQCNPTIASHPRRYIEHFPTVILHYYHHAYLPWSNSSLSLAISPTITINSSHSAMELCKVHHFHLTFNI